MEFSTGKKARAGVGGSQSPGCFPEPHCIISSSSWVQTLTIKGSRSIRVPNYLIWEPNVDFPQVTSSKTHLSLERVRLSSFSGSWGRRRLLPWGQSIGSVIISGQLYFPSFFFFTDLPILVYTDWKSFLLLCSLIRFDYNRRKFHRLMFPKLSTLLVMNSVETNVIFTWRKCPAQMCRFCIFTYFKCEYNRFRNQNPVIVQ